MTINGIRELLMISDSLTMESFSEGLFCLGNPRKRKKKDSHDLRQKERAQFKCTAKGLS